MSLVWICLFTLFIVFIQNVIYHKDWVQKKLEYHRYFDKRTAYPGEQVLMVEELANRKLLPVPLLKLESRIDSSLQFGQQASLDVTGDHYHKSLFSLLPYMKITRRHKVTCLHRGHYQLKTVDMTFGDLLGITSNTVSRKVMAEIIVFPQVIDISDIPLPAHHWQGDFIVRRWIMPDPFIISGVREYMNGDPLHMIHWKATAKTGVLHVHQREFTADHKLMIYLNFSLYDDLWMPITDPERVELGISYAASIAQQALVSGIETGFACNGYQLGKEGEPLIVESRQGKEFVHYMFEEMAKLVIKKSSVTFTDLLDLELQKGIKHKDILLITSFVNERMREQIEMLKAAGNSVEILLLDHLLENDEQAEVEEEDEDEELLLEHQH